jgi:hypothetical protein
MEEQDKDKIFSKRVKAGKRTYFIDVKSTRQNDYFVAITESRKVNTENGFAYEKSKIYLYKEDFNKFVEALESVVNHVKTDLMPDFDFDKFSREQSESDFEGGSNLKWD